MSRIHTRGTKVDVLFDATSGAITTTTLTTSAISGDLSGATAYPLIIFNTLNQAGNYQLNWSPDNGTSWYNIGATVPLSAGSGGAVTLFPNSTLGVRAGLVRIQYTATVAPTSGTLLMWLHRVFN